MIKVTDECLIHIGDKVQSTNTGLLLGTIDNAWGATFKIIKFHNPSTDFLTLNSISFDYATTILKSVYVEMTPELYKERVLEYYHDNVRQAQSIFNCAEKRAKEICAQMLEAVNVN